MPLKNLSHFTSFNAPLFLDRKELRFVSAQKWVEKNKDGTETNLGVKVTVLIFKDETEYQNEKNNVGEQLVVKVQNVSPSDYDGFQPMITICEIVDVEKAVIYGEFRNQLSLTAVVIEKEK